MKFLLDTHSFLWFIGGHTNLSPTARTLIEEVGNQPLLSIASLGSFSNSLRLPQPTGGFAARSTPSYLPLTRGSLSDPPGRGDQGGLSGGHKTQVGINSNGCFSYFSPHSKLPHLWVMLSKIWERGARSEAEGGVRAFMESPNHLIPTVARPRPTYGFEPATRHDCNRPSAPPGPRSCSNGAVRPWSDLWR